MASKHALYTVSVDFADNGDVPTIVIMHRDSDKPGACVRHIRTLRGKRAVKFYNEYLMTEEEQNAIIKKSLIEFFGLSEEEADTIVNDALGITKQLSKEATDDE